MFAYVVPLLIYWLVLFVLCYIVVEVGQDQLYDEVTPRVGLKVAFGTLLLAMLLTWLRPSLDKMLTSDIAWTVLLALAGFGVFTLVFQFQPQHAAWIGALTMVLSSGLATLGVDSLTKPRPVATSRPVEQAKPIRKSLSPLAPPKTGNPPTPKAP
jgi:thiol:disulfide interchange protein